MLRRYICFGLILFSACLAAHAAPDQWVEVHSSHFAVLTDANEKQGRHIADQFERMRWVFGTLFPKANVDPAEPIIVVAAKNQNVFQTMEPAAYLAKGQLKLSGFYSRTEDKNYILLRLDTQAGQEHPFVTIYHEYTHLQFRGAASWMPLWLNEGLAEFMQNTEFRDKDVLLGQTSVDDILFLRRNQLIPLNALFAVDAKSPYYHQEQKGTIFYAESWALTHYLEMTDFNKHTNQIGEYMTLLSQHTDPATAAAQAFGDLKQLERQLADYVQAGNYKEFVLSSAAAPINEATFTVETVAPNDIDARRADVLEHVDRLNEARALLEKILKENPKNVLAHEAMGLLEFRAGNRDEARKLYEQAIQLDSGDYLAYYYYASLAMNLQNGDLDKAIESALRKAIELNPRFAPPYDRLAVFYARKRENLDEAHLLGVQAIQLDPGEIAFRLNSASVLMAMKRYDDAQAVLKIAEKMAKDPDEVTGVENLMRRAASDQKIQAEADAYASSQKNRASESAEGQPSVATVVSSEHPKHADAPANGAKHRASGTIHAVACSYPSVLEFTLETTTGKSFALFNNQMSRIDFSVVGLTLDGPMNPCIGLEGRKAEVEYIESADKSVDGQVIAIELRK